LTSIKLWLVSGSRCSDAFNPSLVNGDGN